MLILRVTICKPDGEVLDTFLAKTDHDYPYAAFPENMMAQVIRECIEENFETEDKTT